MKTLIEPIRTFHDHRGSLFEPVTGEHLGDKQNVHVVLTAPGYVRGNHRHLAGTEIAVVTGPALVRLKEDGALHDVAVPDGETWRFTIPAGVTHAYKNPGPGTMVLIGFNTELHDPAAPGAVRDDIL